MPGWSSVNFVRPAHGLVALHGATVVPVKALGLTAGNSTQGHRFEATVDPVVLQHADSYAATLRNDGAVIASFAERRAEIVRQLHAAAAKVGGGARADRRRRAAGRSDRAGRAPQCAGLRSSRTSSSTCRRSA